MKMSGEKKEERWKTRVPAKVALTEINEYLMCQLCIGYLIDATAIIECQHTFCKSCILKYLETNSYCPICEVQLNIAKPLLSLRSDENLQKLVYKLVPGLVSSEIQRRKEFGLKINPDAATASEEASFEGLKETDELCFLAPDDSVTLSLEYFKSEEGEGASEVKSEDGKSSKTEVGPKSKSPPSTAADSKDKANDRRYLSCPAAVSVGILKKFIRQKYGLSDDYRVDLLYNGEAENNLENDLTLLDLSFIYKWKKDEPMCFHYRIFDRPSKTLPARPPVKRAAPVLDEPPPDDAPPSGSHHNAPSPGSSAPSTTKQPRLGTGSTTTSDSKGGQTTTTVTSESGGQGSKKERGKSFGIPSPEQDQECSGFSSSPTYSSYDSLSPTGKGAVFTTSSSSPDSPSSPLKMSIKADGKTHRHRHRHHKEKHKRKSKSKSKSKDRDKSKERDKNKDKDRYKYNAHPNPTQSQTITVKPGKHRHRHHHKNRDKDGDKLTSVSNAATSAAMTPLSIPAASSPAPPTVGSDQRSRTSSVTSVGSISSSGIELTPIPIQTGKQVPPSTSTSNGQKMKNIKIPDSLQLQVPKSVTLIPVTPGVTKTSRNVTSSGEKSTGTRPTSQTFTHPITNKSLHQITVTEVPPPNVNPPPKTSVPSANNVKVNQGQGQTGTTKTGPSGTNSATNNIITIEKCAPTPSHPAPKQLFNGPGSMEITKIYCDTTSAQNSAQAGQKPKSNSGFDASSQMKLKGLDISITPTPPSYGKSLPQMTPGSRKVEEPPTYGKLNVAGIPKIPGVSILPQAVHNAHKEQQRKLSSGQMSFSCTKITPESNGVKVNSSASIPSVTRLSGATNLKNAEHQRSPSPATSLNGKSGRTPPRKCSADSVYENSSRGPSPSPGSQSRKMSLPISIVSGGDFSNRAFQDHQVTKSRDNTQNQTTKGQKRSYEATTSMSASTNKRPRTEMSHQSKLTQLEKKETQRNESLPLDLSGTGRSSRLTPPHEMTPSPAIRVTPPGSDIVAGNHSAIPMPLHLQTPPTTQSQSSPKLSHKNQSSPSIDSIVENLTQKHQRSGSMQQQRSSMSSTSSKESLSPPNPRSSPPTYHPDLLTLSNAAATARKMSHQKQNSTSASSSMTNLLAAASAMTFNPNPTVGQISPGSAAAAASMMLPGLLHQLGVGHHHQLSAMMLSPPGSLTGPQGIKTSMLGQGGIYGGYGLNGRMTSLTSFGGTSVGPSSVSALSPPSFYNSRTPPTSSTLKIPNLTKPKSRSKSPTNTPATNGIQQNVKGSKSPKSNGTSPPRVTSPNQPITVKPPVSQSGASSTQPKSKPVSSSGGSFSFGISNFLKNDSKSGVDPNAKAIVTSSSAGLVGLRPSASKSQTDKVKGQPSNVSKPSQSQQSASTKSREQSLPVSKLLGFESPPKKIEKQSENSSEKPKPPSDESIKSSRLGDLGLALGLIPCDPPVVATSPTTLPHQLTSLPVAPPVPNVQKQPSAKSFSIPSLLPSSSIPTTVQQQNQAVRTIPNPSLLSSRQNSNAGLNNGVEPKIWKNVSNKADSAVTVPPSQQPPSGPPPSKEPQSIELNMRLWIDRYENGRAQQKLSPTKDSPAPAVTPEDSKSPLATFSASVPSPPTNNSDEQDSKTNESPNQTPRNSTMKPNSDDVQKFKFPDMDNQHAQGPKLTTSPISEKIEPISEILKFEPMEIETSKVLDPERYDLCKESNGAETENSREVGNSETKNCENTKNCEILKSVTALADGISRVTESNACVEDECAEKEAESKEDCVAVVLNGDSEAEEGNTFVQSVDESPIVIQPTSPIAFINQAEFEVVPLFSKNDVASPMDDVATSENEVAGSNGLDDVISLGDDEKCDSPALVIDEDEEEVCCGQEDDKCTGGLPGTMTDTEATEEDLGCSEDGPPLQGPGSPYPKGLTLLIGSEGPFPLSESEAKGPPSTVPATQTTAQGENLDKVAAASLHNNNNVCPGSGGAGTEIITTPPSTNSTPPLPTSN